MHNAQLTTAKQVNAARTLLHMDKKPADTTEQAATYSKAPNTQTISMESVQNNQWLHTAIRLQNLIISRRLRIQLSLVRDFLYSDGVMFSIFLKNSLNTDLLLKPASI